MATGFLRWFVPQIAAYGVFALGTALFNTRRRFVGRCLGTHRQQPGLHRHPGLVRPLVGPDPSWLGVADPPHRTGAARPRAPSLGVVLQGVALVPSLVRRTRHQLRWRWNPHDEAMRCIVRLAGWTFGFVLANQVALFIVIVLAGSVPGADPVSSYTYAYTFFQTPLRHRRRVHHVASSRRTWPRSGPPGRRAGVPAPPHRRPARHAGPHHPLRRRHAPPGPAGGRPAPRPRPQTPAQTHHHRSPPWPCSPSGCPGFCTFLYMVRVLQSMQRTQVGLLPLPGRERHQHRAGRGAGPPARRPRPGPVAVDRLHGGRRHRPVRLPQWFGRLADPETWPPLRRVAVACSPMARRRPGRRPTSRPRRPRWRSWSGWVRPSSSAAWSSGPPSSGSAVATSCAAPAPPGRPFGHRPSSRAVRTLCAGRCRRGDDPRPVLGAPPGRVERSMTRGAAAMTTGTPGRQPEQ